MWIDDLKYFRNSIQMNRKKNPNSEKSMENKYRLQIFPVDTSDFQYDKMEIDA